MRARLSKHVLRAPDFQGNVDGSSGTEAFALVIARCATGPAARASGLPTRSLSSTRRRLLRHHLRPDNLIKRPTQREKNERVDAVARVGSNRTYKEGYRKHEHSTRCPRMTLCSVGSRGVRLLLTED